MTAMVGKGLDYAVTELDTNPGSVMDHMCDLGQGIFNLSVVQIPYV